MLALAATAGRDVAAPLLRAAVAPGGTLIVSGLQTHERAEVVAAFPGARVGWEKEELSWVSIAFNFPAAAATEVSYDSNPSLCTSTV